MVTWPERMQRVQTYFLTTRPPSMTRSLLILGLQIFRVFLLEWLTLFPNNTDLPHTSHLAMRVSIGKSDRHTYLPVYNFATILLKDAKNLRAAAVLRLSFVFIRCRPFGMPIKGRRHALHYRPVCAVPEYLDKAESRCSLFIVTDGCIRGRHAPLWRWNTRLKECTGFLNGGAGIYRTGIRWK